MPMLRSVGPMTTRPITWPPGIGSISPGHPPDLSAVEATGFIDGPEIDVSNPPQMPVQGQATYGGPAGGIYRYQYGDSWGELAGTLGVEEYEAIVTLTADFSDNTLSGCIGCQGDIENPAFPSACPSGRRGEGARGPAYGLPAASRRRVVQPGRRHVRTHGGDGQASRTHRHAIPGFLGRTVLEHPRPGAIPVWWQASVLSGLRKPTAAAGPFGACSTA